jgi:oligopeptide/dipeptide ABC transporter ATP-binding protein
VSGLSVAFTRPDGKSLRVLDKVSFDLHPSETLGIVGESGSGKSVMALAIMGLLGRQARIPEGRILFDGAEERPVRGQALSMVFQHARRALNPRRRIGQQLQDVLAVHRGLSGRLAADEAVRMLTKVGIPDPQARAAAYPFELSGGICQRVMIALALAGSPRLLIADEPTTGLDVTTQALILDQLTALVRQRAMAMLLITHDLGLAAERCDRILVMHSGQVVEVGPAAAVLSQPSHPYTQGLVRATPQLNARLAGLSGVPGAAPDLARQDLPACRFFDRCQHRLDRCAGHTPPMAVIGEGHALACWRRVA